MSAFEIAIWAVHLDLLLSSLYAAKLNWKGIIAKAKEEEPARLSE